VLVGVQFFTSSHERPSRKGVFQAGMASSCGREAQHDMTLADSHAPPPLSWQPADICPRPSAQRGAGGRPIRLQLLTTSTYRQHATRSLAHVITWTHIP
jgi:hypothetical protein